MSVRLISGGVIGLILGTVFRIIAYGFFVFKDELDQEPEYAHDRERLEGAESSSSISR